jgi:acetolactate synthase regulatory subunit
MAPAAHRDGDSKGDTVPMNTTRLSIELDGGQHSLMRVLMVLHRRACTVTSVDFASADSHYRGRLIIGLVAPPAHRHCVRGWLENLVEVRAVENGAGAAS